MRALVVVVAAVFWSAGAGVADARVQPDPDVAFTISDERIGESSGLAASIRHPGVVYTHNDSNGGPVIYAVGPDGRTRATLTLVGAQNRDWEAIAVGRDETGPALFVGDIGDNTGGAWPYVTVYRVPEPARLRRDRVLQATAFRLRYEDGPRDAESLLIDPRTNRLYVAGKQFGGALYEAPARLRTDRINVLRRIGSVPLFATDGAYAPNGQTFAIRTYYSAHIYSAPGHLLDIVSLPKQKQGESITYSADGRSLLVGSEGVRQPVYRVRLPESTVLSRTSASASVNPVRRVRSAGPSVRGRDEAARAGSGGPGIGLLLAVGGGIAVAYGLWRRRF